MVTTRSASSRRVTSSTALLLLALAGGLAFLFFSKPTSATSARRFDPSPVPEESEERSSTFQRRIIAVGDIHGDLTHFLRILRHVGLVDLKGQWIGGEATLVQTGDIVDRGKDTIALYRFMDILRPQAAEAGGQVVSLLGNHEIMNAMGDWRYVTAEDIATFGGERQRRHAMTEGWIGQTWRANYSITARVDYPPLPPSSTAPFPLPSAPQLLFSSPSAASDNPKSPFWQSAASFVHGGITPSYIERLLLAEDESPIDRINEIGQGLMESLAEAGSPLSLPRNATKEQREFWSSEGPMWDRSYAMDENEDIMCARADLACELLGVRRLIMGHTPSFEGMVSRCDGQVILIDTGISRAYGGVLSALQIEYTLAPESADELRSTLQSSSDGVTGNWLETEVVTAIYLGKEDAELGRWERVVEVD